MPSNPSASRLSDFFAQLGDQVFPAAQSQGAGQQRFG
jgi:hypothetical protein